MRPIPFEELLTRIFDEYQQQRSIFGIPEQQFYSPVKVKLLASSVKPVPLPSALLLARTRNLRKTSSPRLTGGRFIELKPSKFLTAPELEKPCIDAEDECFNTEWSTEFTLLKARMNTSKLVCPAPSRSDVPAF